GATRLTRLAAWDRRSSRLARATSRQDARKVRRYRGETVRVRARRRLARHTARGRARTSAAARISAPTRDSSLVARRHSARSGASRRIAKTTSGTHYQATYVNQRNSWERRRAVKE